MRIALVRHFRVITGVSWYKFLNAAEFRDWMAYYDTCGVDIRENAAMLCGDWPVCYSSDADRALSTASCIHSGVIIRTNELREIPLSPALEVKIRLPLFVWFILGRISWFFSLASQEEGRHLSRRRIESFLSMVIADGYKDVLVVCHGGLMLQFRTILRSRGFRGKHFLYPRNGIPYVFEKSDEVSPATVSADTELSSAPKA